MKPKCKCPIKIIPVNEYDRTPLVVHEDDKWRYTIGPTGHLTRLRKKSCCICGENMSYVVIFEYAKHRRVERFCRQHASEFGELPVEQELANLNLTNKQKLAIQKWTNIRKVNW